MAFLPNSQVGSLNAKSTAQQMQEWIEAQQRAQMAALNGQALQGLSPSIAQLLGQYAPPTSIAPRVLDVAKLEKLKSAAPRTVLQKTPDLVECITAWRAWKVIGNRLHALGSHGEWPAKKAMGAVCNSGHLGMRPHAAPDKRCSCGVWAFRTLETLQPALADYGDILVLGQVSLWGRVIECENGWRAEFAYPKELWLFDESLEQLGYEYGVPVRTA